MRRLAFLVFAVAGCGDGSGDVSVVLGDAGTDAASRSPVQSTDAGHRSDVRVTTDGAAAPGDDAGMGAGGYDASDSRDAHGSPDSGSNSADARVDVSHDAKREHQDAANDGAETADSAHADSGRAVDSGTDSAPSNGCECSDGPCCDGCNFLIKGAMCQDGTQDPGYTVIASRCDGKQYTQWDDGPSCVKDGEIYYAEKIEQTVLLEYCSGASSACDGDKLEWEGGAVWCGGDAPGAVDRFCVSTGDDSGPIQAECGPCPL